MQRHECNKHNYLCINDSLKFFFPYENQGVTLVVTRPATIGVRVMVGVRDSAGDGSRYPREW
jgi:hypothetical protein